MHELEETFENDMRVICHFLEKVQFWWGEYKVNSLILTGDGNL
jgi:hypothetical protein